MKTLKILKNLKKHIFYFLVKTYLASNLAKEEAAFNLSFCALAEAFFNFSKRFNAFVISLKMVDASDVAG